MLGWSKSTNGVGRVWKRSGSGISIRAEGHKVRNGGQLECND